jgi:hypothetical protein
MPGFADVWNATNREKEARRRLLAEAAPKAEVLYRRPVRVAPPIAIKDEPPKRRGFTRSQIAADVKGKEKY